MVSIDHLISINRDLDPVNDISFIRMRSMKNEILLAPGKVVTESLQVISQSELTDEDLSLIVIQNPNAEAKHL